MIALTTVTPPAGTNLHLCPFFLQAQIFRSHDRRCVEAKVFQELGIDKNAFDRLPRQLQVACWRGEGWATCIPSTCWPHGLLLRQPHWRGYGMRGLLDPTSQQHMDWVDDEQLDNVGSLRRHAGEAWLEHDDEGLSIVEQAYVCIEPDILNTWYSQQSHLRSCMAASRPRNLPKIARKLQNCCPMPCAQRGRSA